MEHEQLVQGGVMPVLDRLRSEYHELLNGRKLSLEKLFSSRIFSFAEFGKGFKPHPLSDRLKEDADLFSRRYGAWLKKSRHFINCAWHLYPSGNYDRVLTITKNLSVGFYLNDVMGRDVFNQMPEEEQHTSRTIIENMALLDERLLLKPDAHPLELANAEVLREFRENAPPTWFRNFLRLYCYHLHITHRDRNVASLGYIPDVYEYIDNRCHYAAVHHLILWIEYSTGHFLDRQALAHTNIPPKLERLHWVAAAFPALANDLFSFENEVIDNGCDSNLVTVIALNNPGFSLAEAIERSGEMVRNILGEITGLLTYLQQEIGQIRHLHPELSESLARHLEDIAGFVTGSWIWQSGSIRYKRMDSLWSETANSAEVSLYKG